MKMKNLEKNNQFTVSCSGDKFFHPKVFLKIDQASKKVSCPYCNKVFEF